MGLNPCRECGEPGTQAETCPYCGAPGTPSEDVAAHTRKSAGLGWGFVIVVSAVVGLVCFGSDEVGGNGDRRVYRDYAAHPAAVQCGDLMRRLVSIRPISLPAGSELTISNPAGSPHAGNGLTHGPAVYTAQFQQPLTCTLMRTTRGWVVTRLTVASQRLKQTVTRSPKPRTGPDLPGGSLPLGFTVIAIDDYELELPRQ